METPSHPVLGQIGHHEDPPEGAGGENTIAAPDFPERGIDPLDATTWHPPTAFADGYMSGVRPPARLAADTSLILCPSCKHPIDHHGAPGTGCVIPHHDDTDILCPCLHSPNWIAHTLLMALSDSADAQLEPVAVLDGQTSLPIAAVADLVSAAVDSAIRGTTTAQCDDPHLGLATTANLLAEISARIEVHGPGLNYRTVDPS